MYGLSIITNVKDDQQRLLESIPSLWFSKNLDNLCSIWIEEIEDIDDPETLREAIKNGFWYTNYYRRDIHYMVKIFKVEEDVEINI